MTIKFTLHPPRFYGVGNDTIQRTQRLRSALGRSLAQANNIVNDNCGEAIDSDAPKVALAQLELSTIGVTLKVVQGTLTEDDYRKARFAYVLDMVPDSAQPAGTNSQILDLLDVAAKLGMKDAIVAIKNKFKL